MNFAKLVNEFCLRLMQRRASVTALRRAVATTTASTTMTTTPHVQLTFDDLNDALRRVRVKKQLLI